MFSEKRTKDTHLLGKRQDSPKFLKKNFVGFTALNTVFQIINK